MMALFRNGTLALIVLVTLLNHQVCKYQQLSLQQQLYLNPHPVELQLKNHT